MPYTASSSAIAIDITGALSWWEQIIAWWNSLSTTQKVMAILGTFGGLSGLIALSAPPRREAPVAPAKIVIVTAGGVKEI